MNKYEECPCHNCNEHDEEFYDCACDMGPLPEVCSSECPQYKKCDVIKHPENYTEDGKGSKCQWEHLHLQQDCCK